MATYLLTWNPDRWPWRDLGKNIAEVERKGHFIDTWSTGVTKKIQPGDRVFLMKLGQQIPRGIMASGIATTTVFEDLHWDKEEGAKGRTALYVEVRFDVILDPKKRIFPRVRLDDPAYSKMIWEPPASGRTIPNDIAQKLEKDWADFVGHAAKPSKSQSSRGVESAEHAQQDHTVGAGFGTPETNKRVERAAIQFVTNHYESHGWDVKSVEVDRRGFDLLCEKDAAEEHVEVKGIQGKAVSFIITSSEVQQAKTDKRFVLCVVTSAISKQPRLMRYGAKDFVRRFSLEPMSFWARLRS